MSVKGKQREQTEFKKELFVGFTSVRVVAVNPSRDELNKLLGKEADPKAEEIKYLSTDDGGNDRLRMAFWLHDELRDKYFVYSFNLTNKERQNKDKTKVQIINSTCDTNWVPYILNSAGEPTEKYDEKLIQSWFKVFTNKEKEEIGKKKWKKAISGEEELGTLVRSWLGRLNFFDPDTEVVIDTEKLFKENYKEIRGLIDGDFDTPFTILLGVRTDENDASKKYQQIWGKSFLPSGFMKYINKGLVFPSETSKRMWKRFEDEVSKTEYGFDSYHELVPLTEYIESRDIASAKGTKAVTPHSSDY